MKNYKSCSMKAVMILIVFLTSCNKASNVEERNKALLTKAHDEMLTKGNLDFADENFADDYNVRSYPGKGPSFY